jgi:hypothetical protein
VYQSVNVALALLGCVLISAAIGALVCAIFCTHHSEPE